MGRFDVGTDALELDEITEVHTVDLEKSSINLRTSPSGSDRLSTFGYDRPRLGRSEGMAGATKRKLNSPSPLFLAVATSTTMSGAPLHRFLFQYQ